MTNNQLTKEHATNSELQMLIDSHEKGLTIFMRAEAYYLMAKELRERREAEAQIVGYFAYDNDGGFTNHDTAECAQKEAQDAIEYFRESACDGWSDETDSVCWGAIIQQSTKTGERPVGPDDSVGEHVSSICDYELLPELPEKSK